VLTGQVKIDTPALAHILPQKVQQAVQAFSIGKGYELSGDFTVFKNDITRSYFSGYFKGKAFELLGSELDTLLSNITVSLSQIELTDFRLSDTAGLCTIDRLKIEEKKKNQWEFSLPKIAIQDFRPSLLKKIGVYRGRIKPLNIRRLTGYQLRGYINDPTTWEGKGHFYFVNTFKRQYNLLDIPFEIIGRLGLDFGLLIPVRGELDYQIEKGKILFTDLSDSYSDGKLSQFFLSPHRPSYIGFDGNLNINVKMKQYVLLKITEPFTLSITGSVENPRYFLN